MDRIDTSSWPCSIARSVKTFGDHWNLLIVRQALMGARRFNEYRKPMGISRNMLTLRLRALVETGILKKVEYQTKPLRHEYLLTQKGLDIVPMLITFATWENKWNMRSEGPSQRYWHASCGHETHAIVVCDHCAHPISARSLVTEFITPEAIEFAKVHCANPIIFGEGITEFLTPEMFFSARDE